MIDYPSRKPKIKRRITLSKETEKAVQSLIITLSALIFVLGVTFLASTSKSTQKGYLLQQLEKEHAQLESQNSDITRQLTNSTTSTKIEEEAQLEEMTEAQEKQYLRREDNEI